MAKIFQRLPLVLRPADAEDFSRFLIEPRDQPTITYSPYTDKVMIEVRIKFDSFLNINYPKDLQAKLSSLKQELFAVTRNQRPCIENKAETAISEERAARNGPEG